MVGGGGNPKLEPWRAKELDVGYEWYGGKASYFSVHGFYMWLDNYIYTQALPVDFSGLTPPPTELANLRPECNVHHQSDRQRRRARQRQGRLDRRSRGQRRVRVRPAVYAARRIRRDRQRVLHRLQARTGGGQRTSGERAPRLLEMGLRRHRLLREERLPGAGFVSSPVGVQGRSRRALHQLGLHAHRSRTIRWTRRSATPSSPVRGSTGSASCSRSATC